MLIDMRWKPFILGFISVVLLWSCQQNKFQKHEQGFEYIMFESYPDSTKPKIGDVIVLSMDYYLNNDSLLFSSKELGNPFRMKLKRSNPMGATIDDAIATDTKSLKILHGTGTGALKVAIRQYLSTIDLVESVKDEKLEMGGAGISVIQML